MAPEPSDLDRILSLRRDGGEAVVNVDEETTDLLIFQIDQVQWAFPGACIREILSQVEIFFVPGCIPSLEGVINVRGDIETVINLSDLLGPKTTPYAPGWAILLGNAGGLQSGIRVDKVIDVLTVPRSALREVPATLPEKLRPVVGSVLMYRDQPVSVLALDRIFADYGRRLEQNVR